MPLLYDGDDEEINKYTLVHYYYYYVIGTKVYFCTPVINIGLVFSIIMSVLFNTIIIPNIRVQMYMELKLETLNLINIYMLLGLIF